MLELDSLDLSQHEEMTLCLQVVPYVVHVLWVTAIGWLLLLYLTFCGSDPPLLPFKLLNIVSYNIPSVNSWGKFQ